MWPPYTTAERATMVFDAECRVENDPQAPGRLAWEGVDLVNAGLVSRTPRVRGGA
jgi:carboxylesterase type B